MSQNDDTPTDDPDALTLTPECRAQYAKKLAERTVEALHARDGDVDYQRAARLVTQPLPGTDVYTDEVEVSVSNLTSDRHAVGSVTRTDVYILVDGHGRAISVSRRPFFTARPDTGGETQ